MHDCTRFKQECNNKRKYVNLMFDHLWDIIIQIVLQREVMFVV